MEKRKGEQRVEYIDSFRGIACIIVLFVHLWYNMAEKYAFEPYFKNAFYGFGKYAVAIFFVLSGYFSIISVRSKQRTESAYIFQRFMRLYVPMAVVAVFGWCVEWIDTKEQLIETLDLTTLKGHLWTVAVEYKYILVFGICYYLVVSLGVKKKHTIIGIVALSIVCMKIFSPHSWLENAQGLQWYVPIFACGIIIALIEDETAKSYSTIKNYTADLIFLLTTLTVVVMIPIVRNLLFGSEVDTSLTRKYLFFGFVAAIQLYALLNSKIVKKLYDSMTVVQWIGKMGYSIYLIHYIVFWKVAQYNVNIVIYIVASISSTAVLSVLSYYYIEQKFVGWILKKLA